MATLSEKLKSNTSLEFTDVTKFGGQLDRLEETEPGATAIAMQFEGTDAVLGMYMVYYPKQMVSVVSLGEAISKKADKQAVSLCGSDSGACSASVKAYRFEEASSLALKQKTKLFSQTLGTSYVTPPSYRTLEGYSELEGLLAETKFTATFDEALHGFWWPGVDETRDRSSRRPRGR